MESRPRREIKLPAKFKEEEGAAVGKKKAPKDAEEDDPVVYCICRKPYKEGDFMIHCDKCKEWFHGNCVKVTQREAAKIKKYVCPTCLKEETPAEAPLVLEEPSKVPKKHRSLETVKGDKAQPETGPKAAKSKAAEAKGSEAKAAEAKPSKAPAGAKSSGAGSKASKAAEVAKESAAAKPHEKTGNGAEPKEKEKTAKRKAPEGTGKGAEKAKGEDKQKVAEEPKGQDKEEESTEGTEGKEVTDRKEVNEGKEGAAPVKARPKKEDLVCSACRNKGHIRTHRECPLFGQLPSPSNGKKAGSAAVADQKPASGGAPKTEKHKEVVVPSDEDEPILARKKPAPSPKAPSTSAPPQASMPASKAAPQATDDDDHAHMLHPVNTSSHFDTGAALLVAPEKPLATLETEKPAPAEAKAKAPNAKPQAALSGEKRKMDVGLEGTERASSDAKKARPQIPPLEAASEHSRQGPAEPRTVKTPESAPSGPVAETPRTPKSPAKQLGPESPRKAHEGARSPKTAAHVAPKLERVKSEKKEQAGATPSLSRQESSKGAKRGREDMEGKTGGVKKQGLDQAHSDYKARVTFTRILAGALATDAKEGGAGPQPTTPKRGGDGEQARTPNAGDTATAEGPCETEGPAVLAGTSGGAKEHRAEGSAVGEGSGVVAKQEGVSRDVTGSDGESGLAVLTAGGEVSALGVPDAGAIEKAPGNGTPGGGEKEGEEKKAESAAVRGSAATGEAANLQSVGAAALGGPSGEPTPAEAKPESGGQIEGSTADPRNVTEKGGAPALDEASLLRLSEEVAGEIEGELYAHFGGTGNPYRQQTRMLVFNLRNNPELRSRVLGKEVAPKQLCTATADELARKELSDWRHAKEEALSALKVLTEDPLEALRRVRKKTHKGEEDVEMDKDRMAAAIMEGEKNEREGEEEEEAGGANAKEEEPGPSGETVAEEPLKRQRSAGGAPMTSADVTVQKTGEASNDGKVKRSAEPAQSGTGGAVKEEHVSAAGSEQDQNAGTEGGPAGNETGEGGLSLEEYLEACMTAGGGSDKGSEDGGDEKMGEWVASDDEEEKVEAPAKEESVAAETGDDDQEMDDFLWEGNLMLSGRPCPTIASFVGGERMQIETWPMTVEVKGRVKMADFRAFMTSPQLYKHRVVMVIGLKYLEEAHDSKNHLAIASQNYLEANRVGYAEPVSNLEVYIAPPKAEGLGAFLSLQGDWGNAGELLAVVVKRRSPPEGPPGSEPPAQQRQPGGSPSQGTQPRGQPAAQSGGEDVWSPPTSPFDTPGGQKGPQAWPSKKAEQGPGGGSGPAEAAPTEQDQASMQRKKRDPRLRVFQPPTSSPSPTPPQEEPAGPPGFPIPRPPATLPALPAASPPVPQTLTPAPPVRSPVRDHPHSHAPPVPPNFFPGGGRPPHSGGPGPSPPPFRGGAPASAPSPPTPGLRHQDDDLPDVELPHLGPFQQARPPGILPPLPPGPPPSHMQPPFPYMGHTPPRGPLPPLPPGPPPPHIQQHDGRPGPAPYLPPPPSFQGPALTSGGAPQRGHDSNRGRRRRGGRNRKQGPVLGGDQMSDERVMAQWLQEEAGSDSDGRGMRYWANGSPLVGE